MKLRISIDGIPHEIDSTDPELLSKWIVEIFGRLPVIYPSTLIEFQARASWLPVRPDSSGPWEPDWAADSRVISQTRQARSPRELVAELGKQLDELEKLTNG